MIKEAIILAGGLGTRLRSVVPDLPKCMAPVAGKPFLSYVIDHLLEEGIEQFIFSLGYKHEAIEAFLNKRYPALSKKICIEKEPLGTGGAIQLASRKAVGPSVIVVNGDTLFSVHVRDLASFHEKKKADCTVALKPMKNFDRYGVVELETNGAIRSFREKQFYRQGLINGGVYALDIESLLKENLPEKFSFEKEYLEKLYSKRQFLGMVQDVYFIDIGIPEDYERAQTELPAL